MHKNSSCDNFLLIKKNIKLGYEKKFVCIVLTMYRSEITPRLYILFSLCKK